MREQMTIWVTLRTTKTLLLAILATGFHSTSIAGPPGSRAGLGETRLNMSQVVVCRSIEGFEKYEKLPSASMTSDEKLLLYFRPTGYKTELVNGQMQAHFTEDGQIRRRDDKVVIRQKLKLLDYTAKFEDPSHMIYLRNSISLKGMPPGEYEFVVILRDEVAKSAAVKQVVRFKVVPARDPSKRVDSESAGRSEEADAGDSARR